MPQKRPQGTSSLMLRRARVRLPPYAPGCFSSLGNNPRSFTPLCRLEEPQPFRYLLPSVVQDDDADEDGATEESPARSLSSRSRKVCGALIPKDQHEVEPDSHGIPLCRIVVQQTVQREGASSERVAARRQVLDSQQIHRRNQEPGMKNGGESTGWDGRARRLSRPDRPRVRARSALALPVDLVWCGGI